MRGNEPFVLSAIEEALYTPRQLFPTKVQFVELPPAEKTQKKKHLICSFVPTKMTAENDEAAVITVALADRALTRALGRNSFME